jgi:multiple sugar transport system ATP-binding protein
MPSVILKNLFKKYGNTVLAVESLNLVINDKEFFAILGPSGCGKSSTLRMIAGLEEITSGDIYFDETRVTDLSPAERDIALAFENYALYTHLNVYQNIAFPLKIRKIPSKEIDRRVRETAKFMKLTDILETNVKFLSGGQQQRVGVARALVRNPAVFLLDEPISHLEAKLKESMRAELLRIHNDLKVTTIYVTHDQTEAMSMADRICIMNLGKTQQVGTPKEVYADPVNEFVAGFVGEPPMNILNASILSEDDRLKLEIFGKKINFPDQYMPVLKEVKGWLKGRTVRLGIRPTDIRCFKTKKEDNLIEGEVYFIESRNEGKFVLNIKIGDFYILVKTDGIFEPELNAKIYLKFIEDGIHLFDQDIGINLNRTVRA